MANSSAKSRLESLANKYGISQEYKEQKTNSAPLSDDVTDRLKKVESNHKAKKSSSTRVTQLVDNTTENRYNTYGEDGAGGTTRLKNYDAVNKAAAEAAAAKKAAYAKGKTAYQFGKAASGLANPLTVSPVDMDPTEVQTALHINPVTKKVEVNDPTLSTQDLYNLVKNGDGTTLKSETSGKKVFTADTNTLPSATEYKKKVEADKTAAALEAAEKEAQDSTLAGVARNVLGGTVGAFTSAAGTALDKLQGKPINTNASYNRLNQQANAAQQALQDKAANAIGAEDGTVGRTVSDLVVGSGLSALQTIARMPMGALGAVEAGLSAGTNAMIDSKQNGATDRQAFAQGVAQGIAEGLFEKLSLSNLKALSTDGQVAKSLKDVIKIAGKQMLTEGSEEMFTDWANDITDRIIMGDKSAYVTKQKQYMKSGMNEEDAGKQAFKDLFVDSLMSFAGGAISGLALGTGGQVVANAETNLHINQYNKLVNAYKNGDTNAYENSVNSGSPEYSNLSQEDVIRAKAEAGNTDNAATLLATPKTTTQETQPKGQETVQQQNEENLGNAQTEAQSGNAQTENNAQNTESQNTGAKKNINLANPLKGIVTKAQSSLMNATQKASENTEQQEVKQGYVSTKDAFNVPDDRSGFTKKEYKQALKSGEITVYSDKPISEGNFTASKETAQAWANSEASTWDNKVTDAKVYSESLKIDDVVWDAETGFEKGNLKSSVQINAQVNEQNNVQGNVQTETNAEQNTQEVNRQQNTQEVNRNTTEQVENLSEAQQNEETVQKTQENNQTVDHEDLIEKAVMDVLEGGELTDKKYDSLTEEDIETVLERIEKAEQKTEKKTENRTKKDSKTLKKPGETTEKTENRTESKVKGLERPGERYETPVQKAVYDATKGKNKGKVDTSKVDKSTIGKKKQVHMDLLSGFVNSLGANVSWYTSKADENGQYHGKNGTYDPNTNTFTFDTNAGAMDINDTERLNTVVAHEVTHWFQENSPEAYKEIKNIVFEELNKDGSLEERIKDEMDHMKETRGKSSREAAEGEIVARACEDMLSESAKAKEILNQMSNETRGTFIERIKEVFDKIRGYYNDVLQRLNADSEEAKRIRYSMEGFDKLTKAWDKAVSESVARYTDSNKITGFEDGVASDGVTLEGEKDIQLSERTWEKSGKAYLMDWLDRQSDLSREDKADILRQINEVYKTMQTIRKNNELTDYRQWASVENKDGNLTVITPNGEYPLNIDFSTVCKKRKALDHILNVMVQNGQIADAKDLAGTDIVKLQKIIKENDLEVACALCFVDSKRYRVGEWADGLTNGMYNDKKKWQYGFNQLVDSLVPEGSNLKIDEFNYTERKGVEQPKGSLLKDAKDSELDFTLINKIIKANKKGTWNRSLADAIKAHPELRSHLNSAEILSSVGFDPIREQNPALFDIINEKGGSSKPKLSFSETAYVNDILMSDAMNPEAAYKVGGVRLQSFSDFMANMVFDYVQMVGELQAKKLPAHAYTKEASFVAMFGKTGIKINMSLVPAAVTDKVKAQYEQEMKAAKNNDQREDIKKKYKDKAGLDENENYIWSEETFPFEVAMQLQADPEYSKNCGTIAVGVSNRHIELLLNDPRIQMVIPYHSSGINPVVAALRNIDLYTDYTKYQNTRYKNGKKIEKADNTFDFYESLSRTNDAKKTADEYLAWCDEKGFVPKFDQFRSNENYYKLLADFRLYDHEGKYAPQHAVGFEEDNQTINKNLYPENMQDLILDGYKITYKDSDGNDVEYQNGGLREAQKVSDKLRDKTKSIIKEYGYRKNYYEDGKYTYDKLIKKEPAKITDFEEYTVPTKNKQVNFKKMRESGSKGLDVLPNELNTQKYVYIDDLGSNVLVNKNGIIHGLQGKITNTSTMETAEVTNALSDILRNSVVVNESALKPENIDEGEYSYILFGLARRSDGQMYLVRTRINRRSDNMSAVEHVDIYNILKGIKAKKIGDTVHGKSGENAELPITLTSRPTITIAELLDIVKENNPQVLPDTVREHYGITGEKDKYVYYSDRDYIRGLKNRDENIEKREEITRANLPTKAKLIVTKSRNNLIKELGEIINANTMDNIKDFRALTNLMVDEYLDTGKIKDSTIETMFEDAYKFSDAYIKAEESAVDKQELGIDEELKYYQLEEFKREVENLKDDLRLARRYAMDQAGKKETTAEEVQDAYKGFAKARSAAEHARANNLLNNRDNSVLGMLLRGETTLEEVRKMQDLNHKGIEAVYEAQKPYEEKAKAIRKFNKERKAKLAEEADSYLQGSENWKDKNAGIWYERETAERNIRDIAPKGAAEALINNYFAPVHEAEADSTRTKNKYRDRVKKLDISRKIAEGNRESESFAVQFIGEAEDNQRRAAEKGEKGKQYGKTAEEWQEVIDTFWAENPKMDKDKIHGAIREFSDIYRELREKANDVLIRNGYEPIEYRAGYFPHFQNNETDGIVSQFKKVFGVEADVTPLPTTINGMTGTFKPGRTWFGNVFSRKGNETKIDAVQGFDKYIQGITDVIYQTDNIQKLRTLEQQIRYNASDEGIQKEIDKIRANDELTWDEQRLAINELLDSNKDYALSNFVVWLDEYTNLLANKKSKLDRVAETEFGRRIYNIVKTLEGNVAGNMVALNPGSWLTNLIPITQAMTTTQQKYLLKGMVQTLKNEADSDNFIDRSDFLTNRRGSENLVKRFDQDANPKGLAKVTHDYAELMDKLSIGMNIFDDFTAESIVRGRYLQNKAEGMSEAMAMTDADAYAASIMADRSKGSQPTLFGSRNPLVKAFTMFQLEVNNEWSWLIKDVPRDLKDKAAGEIAAALLKFLIGTYIFDDVYEFVVGRRPALDPLNILNDTVGDLTGYKLPNMIDAALGRDGFKTKQKNIYESASNLVSNVGDELPFSSLITGEGRIPVTAGLPDLGDVSSALLKDTDPKKKAEVAAREFGTSALYLALPGGGGQIKKIAEGAAAVAQGGSYTYDKDGNLTMQYPVYKDTVGDVLGASVKAALFGKSSLYTARKWVENDFDSLDANKTELYEDLKNTGMSDRKSYELIQELKGIKKKKEKTDYLLDSGLKQDALNKAYVAIQDSDERQKTSNDVADANLNGISTKEYIEFKKYTSQDGVKKEDVLNYINNLNISSSQKDYLYREKEYAESKIDEAPWRSKKKDLSLAKP